MINHVRTLLLNMDGIGYDPNFPGSQYVDPTYVKKKLPNSLAAIRNVIFGVEADKFALNYRLHELMTLLHSTELREYVTAPDSRITYDLNETDLTDVLDRVIVTQLTGAQAEMTVSGSLPTASNSGKLWWKWRIAPDSLTTGTLYRETAPVLEQDFTYSISSELSSTIELPGSELLARFRHTEPTIGDPAPSWNVEVFLRPPKDLGELITPLEIVAGHAALTGLFGPNPAEPYLTFRNLWEQHDHLAYRLGGLVLALAYRIAELPRI